MGMIGTEPLKDWAGLTERIYADRDFSPGGREVALALAWALYHAPEGEDRWQCARKILGPCAWPVRGWRVWRALGEDVPWYDHRLHSNGYGGECEGPRLRPYKPRQPPYWDRCNVSEHHPHLGECRYPTVYIDAPSGHAERDPSICGAHATISVTEIDPVTGWETNRWFCSRHKQRAKEVREQLRAALPERPPPIPNRGGVLPRYFETDWPRQYALAVKHAGGGGSIPFMWEPPYHGVCRDDWPVPGKTVVPKRPQLAVVS